MAAARSSARAVLAWPSGPVALALLLSLTIGAFAATRAIRSQEDIVNTVIVPAVLDRDRGASVSFQLAVTEPRADVLIIDRSGRRVRALALAEPLAEGTHRFHWNGRDDAGERVRAGPYRLRLVLGEQGRDIRPPGTIEAR